MARNTLETLNVFIVLVGVTILTFGGLILVFTGTMGGIVLLAGAVGLFAIVNQRSSNAFNVFLTGRESSRAISWQLIAVYFVFLTVLLPAILFVPEITGLAVPQLLVNIGSYLLTFSLFVVVAIDAYLGGGLATAFALGMIPSVAFAILGLMSWLLSDGGTSGDTPLWAFVLLLVPALALLVAGGGFVTGKTIRWADSKLQ